MHMNLKILARLLGLYLREIHYGHRSSIGNIDNKGTKGTIE